MEQYDNGLTSETINDWVKGDQKLIDLLSNIERTSTSIEEQAELVFHKVSDLYRLPKYPDDIDEDSLIDGLLMETSVYEQVGFIKFLEPSIEQLVGNVLTAIFFMKNGTKVDLNFILDKYSSEGGNPKDIFGIGFKNEGVNVELVFVKKGQSWFDLGCKYFTREIE